MLLTVCVAGAQDLGTRDSSAATPGTDAATPPASHEQPNDAPPSAPANDRIFGILPNYATVERDRTAQQLSSRQEFQLAGLGSFDPYVFPYVGVMVGLGQGGQQSYVRRYATAMADNSIGNFMTSAILPSLLHQDPRYYARERGSVFGRAVYALSRSIITRSSAGRAQFNYSEMAGNFSAAAISNGYYPSSDRSAAGTLTRFASQVLNDALANQMKEFWPDIRAFLARRRAGR